MKIHCFLLRPAHHFLNIVLTMDKLSSMKFQVAQLLGNMNDHYQWRIVHRFILHRFSIGVRDNHDWTFELWIDRIVIFLDSRNYNQEGYGLFGFQVILSKKPERIIISAPGSFYFRGKIKSTYFSSRQDIFEWTNRWSSFTPDSRA